MVGLLMATLLLCGSLNCFVIKQTLVVTLLVSTATRLGNLSRNAPRIPLPFSEWRRTCVLLA